MHKILGANWVTTVLGWGAILAGSIAVKPDLVGFLPANMQPTIVGVCTLVAVVSAGGFAYQVKSKNVTGGVVQQTASGGVAPPDAQNRSASVQDTKLSS